MKRAVVTICSGDYFERMGALTHPTLKRYADRIGADFIVWSDISGYTIAEYKKMEISGLLEHYDRVLYVDTDVIIRDDAPDVFAIVPQDHLGMLKESDYYDRGIALLRFMQQNGFDIQTWDGTYYNAGIFVCSRCHRDLLVPPAQEWNDFRDQSYVNALVASRQAKVFPLPYRFNRVLGMDRVYGEDRLDSYFLHYAGVRVVLSEQETLELIESDLENWRRLAPHYRLRDNIVIVVEGDVGDQIAAEPAVRYARDVVYQGDNLVVVSTLPEAFAHLGLPIYDNVEHVPSLGKYHRRLTRTRGETHIRGGLSHHQVHVCQLSALLALGLELPMESRRPTLAVDPAALASVTEKVRPHHPRELVLLHPGRGAPPNTFPADVWQAYADALSGAGMAVAVIGKQTDPHGIVEFDRSRCLDLVDRLSTATLIALVSQARALVSNDSAPVQIAGAFDNWIGLIATLRNPECILPWRNGSQSWRAESLERKGMYHDYLHCPSGSRRRPLNLVDDERLRECLPTPDRVLQFARSAVLDSTSTL